MYKMTLEDTMLCAKIFAYAMGDRSITLNPKDKYFALELLKKMADQRWDWTDDQKEQFKALVDICSHSYNV